MDYFVNKEKVKMIKDALNSAQKQYELFRASGCNVHDFNMFKGEVNCLITAYENGKGVENLDLAYKNLNNLLAWIGQRSKIVKTENCSNYKLKKSFCEDCKKC